MRHVRAFHTFGLDVRRATFAPPQPAGWAHLCTVRGGIATVRSDRAAWTISREIGVRVPPGQPYVLESRTPCSVRILYVPAAHASASAAGAVAIAPLLRELLERMVTAGHLDERVPSEANLLAVVDDELTALRPLEGAGPLTLPADPGLLALADRILAAETFDFTVASLAASIHVSTRTFERHFARETGISPRRWLRHARLIHALAALEAGANVTEAGAACGYASTGAFIAAFRERFAVSPGAYLRATQAAGEGNSKAATWQIVGRKPNPI